MSIQTLRIHALAHGGAGIGRVVDPEADQRVWFVDGVLPDEIVEVELRKEAKRHVEGDLRRVVTPSPQRVEPPCPFAGRCGGCGWQHVDPVAQAELKREIVAGQLRRLPLKVGPAVPSPRHLHYRRRARLHYLREGDVLTLGLRRQRSREIVDLNSCPVLEPVLDAAISRLRGLVEHLPESGEVHGLCAGGQVVLGLPGVRITPALREAAEALLDETLVGISLRGGRQRTAIGAVHLPLDDDAEGAPVEMGPFAFSQAQRDQNRALVDHVVKMSASAGQRVLELHAGAGNFTRKLARTARRVVAVDNDRDAIASLTQLVRSAGLAVAVKQASAERTLQNIVKQERNFDVVVLDPPRGGMGRDACQDLLRVARRRIVYVSCDPATLARDLEVLIAGGMRCRDLRVFDMMPMTSEVECVATLEAPT